MDHITHLGQMRVYFVLDVDDALLRLDDPAPHVLRSLLLLVLPRLSLRLNLHLLGDRKEALINVEVT